MTFNPITIVILNDVLDNLDISMKKRMNQYKNKVDDWEGMERYLESEFPTRLDTLLQGKGGRLVRLDRDQQTIVSERKRELFTNLENTYKEI